VLVDVVRRLRDESRAIIFIAHKLKEILNVADRITVMRRGRVVGSVDRRDADEKMLGTMMVGHAIDAAVRMPSAPGEGTVRLNLHDVAVARDDGTLGLHPLSLAGRVREIIGIAGVEGSGQNEFAEALYGLRPVQSGVISMEGQDITGATAARRRALGMRYVPPDRQREGLILDFDTIENALLGDQRRLANGPLVGAAAARARADEIGQGYGVAGYHPDLPARSYSGGNQQKLIIGRELAGGAKLLIACAPTRGIDVGAAAAIHNRLRDARENGACVVLISYDLDELRALADRIIVFCGGHAVGELPPERADDSTLGMLMGGVNA